MIKNRGMTWLLTVTLAVAGLAPAHVVAQTGRAERDAQLPSYKPPPRGAPGGRVGGATRGTVKASATLPTIELLAPSGHTGLTASPTPNLYFFVSGPVIWPIRFTISAPLQPAPVIEVTIPPPSAAGVYGLHVADYPVRLEPDIIYTWSVSAILNSERPADDIVASASLLLVTPDPVLAVAPRAEPAARRAALFARAGFWYDAVAAAAEAAPIDHSAALDALMAEVGLVEPGYDRRAAGTATAR